MVEEVSMARMVVSRVGEVGNLALTPLPDPYQRPMHHRGPQNNGFFPPAFPGGQEAIAMQNIMMQQQEQMMQMQMMMQQMAQAIQGNGVPTQVRQYALSTSRN